MTIVRFYSLILKKSVNFAAAIHDICHISPLQIKISKYGNS